MPLKFWACRVWHSQNTWKCTPQACNLARPGRVAQPYCARVPWCATRNFGLVTSLALVSTAPEEAVGICRWPTLPTSYRVGDQAPTPLANQLHRCRRSTATTSETLATRGSDVHVLNRRRRSMLFLVLSFWCCSPCRRVDHVPRSDRCRPFSQQKKWCVGL